MEFCEVRMPLASKTIEIEESQMEMAAIIWLVTGAMVGLVVGRWFEAKRWRSSAGEVHRVSSGGHLYRVTFDEEVGK